MRDGELDALLTITRDADDELEFEFLGSASPTNMTRLLITQASAAIAIADRLERAGIDPRQSAELFQPPSFTAVPVDPDDSRNAEDFGGAFILTYAVVILTFLAILTYGNWVAQSVAEEKSGRVMELLITAATPRQLLTGKVLGTGAAGLTQYLAIVVAAVIGLVANGPISEALGVAGELPFSLPSIGPVMLLGFAAFFLLGFLLYATLYAAAGSMVSRIEDVQQAVGTADLPRHGRLPRLVHGAQRSGRPVGRRPVARAVLQPLPDARPDAPDLGRHRGDPAGAGAARRRCWRRRSGSRRASTAPAC